MSLAWYNFDEAEEERDHDRAQAFWHVILLSWSMEEMDNLAGYAHSVEKSQGW